MYFSWACSRKEHVALGGLALEPFNAGSQRGGLRLHLGESRTEGEGEVGVVGGDGVDVEAKGERLLHRHRSEEGVAAEDDGEEGQDRAHVIACLHLCSRLIEQRRRHSKGGVALGGQLGWCNAWWRSSVDELNGGARGRRRGSGSSAALRGGGGAADLRWGNSGR